MSHDPLCVLSKPCDDETPEHGYCGFSAPNFCIHCHTWCMCGEVRQAEQRMLAKCIAAVEALDVCWYVDDSCQSPNHGILNDVYLALRDLQEKP